MNFFIIDELYGQLMKIICNVINATYSAETSERMNSAEYVVFQ